MLFDYLVLVLEVPFYVFFGGGHPIRSLGAVWMMFGRPSTSSSQGLGVAAVGMALGHRKLITKASFS